MAVGRPWVLRFPPVTPRTGPRNPLLVPCMLRAQILPPRPTTMGQEVGVGRGEDSLLRLTLDSLVLAWTHSEPLRLTRTRMDSIEHSWNHLLGLTRTRSMSLGLSWTPLDSLDLSVPHLGKTLRRLCEKGQRETSWAKLL